MSEIDRDSAAVYQLICSCDGIKAREIASRLRMDRSDVNRLLYRAPLIRDLCYHDDDYAWHGLVRQAIPHDGLFDFSGWYGTVAEFMATDEDAWFDELLEGCRRIGRNLNDTRGLYHSFRDAHATMRQLFLDLQSVECADWEVVFELRIKRSRRIRIYADVLVIGAGHVFSLEFKMKDEIEQDEVQQAAKYCPYLEILFGSEFEVVPALVLTRACDLFEFCALEGSTAEVAIASGDMLFNVFDEYLHFLQE